MFKDTAPKFRSDLSAHGKRARSDLMPHAARTTVKRAHKSTRRMARMEIDRALMEIDC